MRTHALFIAAVLFNSTEYCTGQANYTFRNWYNVQEGTILAPVSDDSGSLVVGSYYLAELWGSDSPDSLAPALDFRLPGQPRVQTTFNIAPGLFAGGIVVIPTVPPNGWAWLQVRAWDMRLGASYEDVAARAQGGYGESLVFYARGGDPYDGTGLPGLPGQLIGLQSFGLRPVVPEPAPWMLMVLGAPVLCWSAFRAQSRTKTEAQPAP